MANCRKQDSRREYSDNEDGEEATATQKGGEKMAYSNPDKDKNATTARKRAMWKQNARRSNSDRFLTRSRRQKRSR
jgi:hypothetical protein